MATCAQRVGLDERATLGEMLSAAERRTHYWCRRVADVMGADRATLQTAEVLARSYERIACRVRKAREYLSL